LLRRFWNWYQTKLTAAVGFLFVTHILQIPHFVWAGDAYLQTGLITYIHPVIDFIMYGIDLVEIPALINVTLLFVAHIRNGRMKRCDRCKELIEGDHKCWG
jgi:hypothetical protein